MSSIKTLFNVIIILSFFTSALAVSEKPPKENEIKKGWEKDDIKLTCEANKNFLCQFQDAAGHLYPLPKSDEPRLPDRYPHDYTVPFAGTMALTYTDKKKHKHVAYAYITQTDEFCMTPFYNQYPKTRSSSKGHILNFTWYILANLEDSHIGFEKVGRTAHICVDNLGDYPGHFNRLKLKIDYRPNLNIISVRVGRIQNILPTPPHWTPNRFAFVEEPYLPLSVF